MSKLIVKVTTLWKHPFFYKHTSNSLGIVGGYKFEIDNDCKECDFWIVWGGLNPGVEYEKVRCSAENVIFLTDEVNTGRRFYQSFLDQFHTVITPRQDIEHANIINWHELNTWHIDQTFDELIALERLEKTKTLSIITSNLFSLDGHKKRYEFANRLIGHFKDKIDVFGRGIRPFKDKFETLSPYKYSIAIENSVVPGYFTEKISECFLSLTVPIYYGCPDISDYFDSNSFYQIDINDYKKSISFVEQIIEEDRYEDQLSLLVQQKNKYLTRYDVFQGLAKLLNENFKKSCKRTTVKIKCESSFQRFHNIQKILQIYNNRSFIPKKWKFSVDFHEKGKFSGKY